MQIEKFLLISNLLDLYGCLLTEKQIDIMNYHYEDDLSLGEISEIAEISRQAVHDTIKRCEVTLLYYEDKLKLWEKQERRSKSLTRLVEEINEASLGQDARDSLIRLCEELEE